MAFDREAAKAEGYSDDEINAYLQAEAEKAKQPAPAVDVGEPPAPQTKINTVGTSPEAMATTAGLGVAPYVVPGAAGAAALYGGGKVYGAWKAGTDAAQALAQSQAAQAQADRLAAQGLQQRFEQRMAGPGQAVRPVAPVAPVAPGSMAGATPTTATGPTSNMPGARAPMAPVAPAGMPAQAPAPGIMERMRALAANKVLQGAGNLAKGSVGPGLAMYSGDLGPKTPQSGRMRGMEINPLTGRPWTPDQIRQYESNPGVYDSQMAPPQMRR